MKVLRPNRMAPKLDATLSTDVSNCFESKTYPGPVIGDSAPSRLAANALSQVKMDG